MRIAIIGAGGVGGYFGAALASAGADVTFVARGATLAALRERGLLIHSPDGERHVATVRAVASPAEVGGADAWLVAVKAWQVAEVARSLVGVVGDGCVVPLQNGIEASDQLASVLGEGSVLNGVARILAFIEAPAVIRHVGARPSVAFGERAAPPTPRVRALADELRRAGLEVSTPDDIRVAVWEKFL